MRSLGRTYLKLNLYPKTIVKKLLFFFFFVLFMGLQASIAQSDSPMDSSIETKPLQVKVFPNPATNVVNILGLLNSQRAAIQIMDTYGNTVLQHQWAIKNNALNIPISSLEPGIYIVSVQSEEQQVQTKFLKR